MSEDAIRAARMMQKAADDSLQAARNMEGTLEGLKMFWEHQMYPDLLGLVERLEALKK